MTILLYITLALYAFSFAINTVGRSLLGGEHLKRSWYVLLLAFLIHSVALIVRIYQSGHAPMASMYETLIFFGWTMVLLTIIVIMRYKDRVIELITIPVTMLALSFGLLNATPPKPLVIVLRTLWFETHVTTSFIAYALFTLAFGGAILYLKDDLGFGASSGGAEDGDGEAGSGYIYRDLMTRASLWGFFFFTVSMFLAAIWAYLAWGTYWMWEPKIIWSFIVWFYYAGAVHANYVRNWRGRHLAVANVIGFFVVLFTYLGVGLLMKSSHSFNM